MSNVGGILWSEPNEHNAEQVEFGYLAWTWAQMSHLQHLLVIDVFRVGGTV